MSCLVRSTMYQILECSGYCDTVGLRNVLRFCGVCVVCGDLVVTMVMELGDNRWQNPL